MLILISDLRVILHLNDLYFVLNPIQVIDFHYLVFSVVNCDISNLNFKKFCYKSTFCYGMLTSLLRTSIFVRLLQI
jgi:hypothetical protein